MPRTSKRVAGLCLAVTAVVVTATPAWAQFRDTTTTGPLTTGTAVVPTPAGVQASAQNFFCTPGRPARFTVSWNPVPAAVDADGKPLVSYYRLTVSVAGGPVAAWASTSGTTSYTGYITCAGPLISSATFGVQAASSATGFAGGYASATATFIAW